MHASYEAENFPFALPPFDPSPVAFLQALRITTWLMLLHLHVTLDNFIELNGRKYSCFDFVRNRESPISLPAQSPFLIMINTHGANCRQMDSERHKELQHERTPQTSTRPRL
tara:strand:- start:1360 stop:1695 length:336 start_codon:yes stop_codon:yes gene_type:complete